MSDPSPSSYSLKCSTTGLNSTSTTSMSWSKTRNFLVFSDIRCPLAISGRSDLALSRLRCLGFSICQLNLHFRNRRYHSREMLKYLERTAIRVQPRNALNPLNQTRTHQQHRPTAMEVMASNLDTIKPALSLDGPGTGHRSNLRLSVIKMLKAFAMLNLDNYQCTRFSCVVKEYLYQFQWLTANTTVMDRVANLFKIHSNVDFAILKWDHRTISCRSDTISAGARKKEGNSPRQGFARFRRPVSRSTSCRLTRPLSASSPASRSAWPLRRLAFLEWLLCVRNTAYTYLLAAVLERSS
jgi:hypothetical protein